MEATTTLRSFEPIRSLPEALVRPASLTDYPWSF